MPAAEEGRKKAEFEREALVHLDVLYGFALRLTGGDEARAEDLVQETAMKAYRHWDRYELGTNCRAWLMTILRNAFVNRYRGRKRHPEVEFGAVEERGIYPRVKDDDPEGRFFDRLVDAEVVAAIDSLPEDFRVPLVLSDLEGLSYAEVAEAVGIPVGTVKSWLHRARHRLQERLFDYAREMGYVR